jgi:hypothetical protein
MQENSQRILREQLDGFREYLESTLQLEKKRLDESLRRSAESKITAIRERTENSIQRTVEQYDRAIARIEGYATDPSLAILAESARESARRALDTTIAFHRQLAETAIGAIQKILQDHHARSGSVKI